MSLLQSRALNVGDMCVILSAAKDLGSARIGAGLSHPIPSIRVIRFTKSSPTRLGRSHLIARTIPISPNQ